MVFLLSIFKRKERLLLPSISHITFIVKNLERSSNMLKNVFGAKEIYSSEAIQFSVHPEKFFLLDSLWIALMEDPTVDLPKSYNHIAFNIPISELEGYRSRIKKAGLKIEKGRSRITGEGESIYFYDYDNHLFELHTGSLEERLTKYNSCQD
ncbi:FosX/FosE/FosI family fosfomycin resistance hydrolase [Enterococcus malodoratus]|uniref:FosX/FosE/FosI family fosfomycin resistance hydrolase n=1 Tax=Enterococcus malodoratus TaxID=71451 RepID=UPI0020734DDE|nr:FosX/FosE/FosI family fosfomycin resistance hydrolase [Enterococcus malodoratus]